MKDEDEKILEEFIKKRKEVEKFMKEELESRKSCFKERLMGKEVSSC